MLAGDSNKIHILGGFRNIQLARHAVVSLILVGFTDLCTHAVTDVSIRALSQEKYTTI